MSNQKPTDMEISKKKAVEFVRSLGMQKDKPEFCDMTVVTDDHEFKCHRVVLASASGFFKALLSSGTKEDLKRKTDLKEISTVTFSEILDCIYKANNIVTEKNVFDVWHAAKQLQIPLLIQDCEMCIKKIMSLENCFDIYQTSKLLDSAEIRRLSWNFILQEFERLRNSDGILMLTASDMKKLVASQTLVTISEDRVVETILRWATYKPEEKSSVWTTEPVLTEFTNAADKNESKIEPRIAEQQGKDIFCLIKKQCGDFSAMLEEQLEKKQQKQPHELQEKHDVERLAREDQKQTKGDDEAASRDYYLPDLLEVSRLCLLSGKCLMKTLWTNAKIRANQRALGIVQDAIDYQILGDRRHDFCPASAVHRSSSELENVIVAINTNTDDLVCRKEDGKWYCMPGNLSGIASSAVCCENNVFTGHDQGKINVYITSLNQWRNLPSLSSKAKVLALLAVGHFLYAVYKDNSCYSIEMLNIRDILDGQVQGQWIKAGTTSATNISISCTTVINDKIIFFGYSDIKDYATVELFDTVTMSSLRVNDIEGPSRGMISFKKGNDAFIIQRNGALWRVRSCPTPPFVEIKYETLLWNFYRDLTGAFLFKDDLLIFGTSVSSSVDSTTQGELAMSGLFKRVQHVPCNKDYRCFTHTVLPKTYLTTEVSRNPSHASTLSAADIHLQPVGFGLSAAPSAFGFGTATTTSSSPFGTSSKPGAFGLSSTATPAGGFSFGGSGLSFDYSAAPSSTFGTPAPTAGGFGGFGSSHTSSTGGRFQYKKK